MRRQREDLRTGDEFLLISLRSVKTCVGSCKGEAEVLDSDSEFVVSELLVGFKEGGSRKLLGGSALLVAGAGFVGECVGSSVDEFRVFLALPHPECRPEFPGTLEISQFPN